MTSAEPKECSTVYCLFNHTTIHFKRQILIYNIKPNVPPEITSPFRRNLVIFLPIFAQVNVRYQETQIEKLTSFIARSASLEIKNRLYR